MSEHTGQGQVIEAEAITQDSIGNWIPATPEPYHPNLLERLQHFFGLHRWTWTVKPDASGVLRINKEPTDDARCVMCGIRYDS